ncbi:adenylate kinase isoenzyme 5-like isoform X9 [Octopus vulgaris]|uniref:Adenylate kinase isoenzyme 5-like isoform X9 n=4 Tax=Octopus TaxID=6643 RepID=A0AA36EXQ0_OCTVU|nr:adenylate kinase isoform X1 [Octopus sinensis]CAI9716932.1 adenylate kinase isoenzyme 5-like isoform X9 [Octopus vulgaris]
MPSVAKVTSLENVFVIFVIGGPGCGKGTQCAKIVSKYGFTHLSSGDLLREEVASGSARGKELSAIMATGKLVPMDTVLELIREAMLSRAATSRGFLIDGYPRELEQGKRFEAEVSKCKFVLNFDVSDETMKARLLDRAKTSGRVDDNEETINKRLVTFHEHTTPVLDYYAMNNKLQTIKAEGSPEEVFYQVEMVFKECCPKLKPCLDECKVIFVVGGPGSGKGTMCAKLVQHYGFCHLSSGDMLREEVASGSARGKELNETMQKGELVPMTVVLQLLREALVSRSSYTKCFLIDGYPRELQQGLKFENEITECAAVLNFTAPDDVLVARLLDRGKTSGRDDDNKETIMKRLVTFHEITQPVIDHYQGQNKVINIDSNNTVDKVFVQAKEAMKRFAS